MQIAGFVKNSFVDYPGKIAAVIFTAGCNWDCFFCHNRSLLTQQTSAIDEAEVWAFLERRRALLDGVVVTGGEPTLQPDLAALLARSRRLGLLCKLDTNGSRPEVVRELLEARLLDYVALDIKTTAADYKNCCGQAADSAAVAETLALVRASGVDFECRTTFLPQLSVEDVAGLAASIAPVPRYALQAYRPPEHFKPTDRFRVMAAGHSAEELRQACEAARVCAGEVILRD